jgi:hypothetical protein
MPAEILQGFGAPGDDGPPETTLSSEETPPEVPWRPLSVRRGLVETDGPYEGVPDHLQQSLEDWVSKAIGEPYGPEESLAEVLTLRLRIKTDRNRSRVGHILVACRQDQDKFLDVIDMALRLAHGNAADELAATLTLGGSVWTVGDDGQSLVRRVSESEQESYERTVSPADEIAGELRTAWVAVYGRHPDPSDAWDHAIKAVELALWPIVAPGKPKATLGSILVELAKAGRFVLRLATSSDKATSVETLVQMLRLMWPNPDRHGTGERRPPSEEEAQNVVQLAVLVIGWVRSGALTLA